MLKIQYEDADILVVIKPAGMESQSSRGFEADMVSEIRNYLRLSTKLSTKPCTGPSEPYVGVIHRLDRPVSGVMVYAKTQRAAAALSRQVQDGRMKKTYRAVVCGKPVDIVGNYVDYLLKDGRKNESEIVDKSVPGAKRAELAYRVLETVRTESGQLLSLVEIDLRTGRHHQIRVQFAGHGTPLYGDGKYNPHPAGTEEAGRGRLLPALSAVCLSFFHPTTGKPMEFSMEPQGQIFKEFGRGER